MSIDATTLQDGQKVKFIYKNGPYADLIGKEFIGDVVFDENEETIELATTICFWLNEDELYSIDVNDAEILEIINQ